MKITEIKFGLTKSRNFDSVRADVTMQIDETDNLDEAWDKLREECEQQCSEDPSWINRK